MFDYQINAAVSTTALQQLAYDAYSPYREVLEPEHWLTLKAAISSEQVIDNLRAMSTLISCTHNGQLAGMAFLVPSGHPTHIYNKDQCYIRFVAVAPIYSGKGIARRLTELCIAQARAGKEREIALHTSEFMNAARHLYESIGFKMAGPINPIFGKKYWLYTMIL